MGNRLWGSVILLVGASLYGQTNPFMQKNPNAPFNVNQVIEQVSHQQMTTGEFVLDTNITYIPRREEQNSPSVAFDGSNYLVVWTDFGGGGKIYGTRVSVSGVVLDPICIVISPGAGSQASPSVAFDGANYLVVWEDRPNGPPPHICGTRVSPSGKVLDSVAITISSMEIESSPSVVFGGTSYLVVWEERRNGDWDIYSARVSPSGVVLDPSGIAISTATDWQQSPSVAFDGTNYLVVWEDRRNYSVSSIDIYGSRVSQTGKVLDLQGVAISAGQDVQQSPSVAFDGSNYLVVWAYGRYNGDYDYDIRGTRVSPSGVVLDPSGIVISNATDWQQSPAVTFDGTNYLVVWEDWRSGYGGDIYGSRVSPSGVVLDQSGIAISTSTYQKYLGSVIFGKTNYLVVWSDHRNGSSNADIFGARVSLSGNTLDQAGITISTEADLQEFPSAAFDGKNYLVAWREEHSEIHFDIYGAIVSPSGVVLTPSDISIVAEFSWKESPSVAFGGGNYLVTWADRDIDFLNVADIYGTRVTVDGSVLLPSRIAISTAPGRQVSPSVVFDSTNFLVVCGDGRNHQGGDIYGARVSTSGTVLDPSGIAISIADNDQYSPAVAFDGSNYLIVWEDTRNIYPPAIYKIYGARFSPAGKILDSSGIKIATDAYYEAAPSIAFDGSNYLVVWLNGSTGSLNIRGARVNLQGVVLDKAGIPISSALHGPGAPAVAFDGTNYLVAWQDNRNGDWDIYGARVSPEGVVIDSFPVCTQPGNQIEPKIAQGPNGQLLVVWSGWTDSINGKPANTMRIWGKFYPFTGIEETGDDRRKTGYELQIYPTPFFSNAVIRFSLPAVSIERSTMSLKIYDSSGRVVKEFKPSTIAARSERNHLTWDGTDDSCQKLPAGVYFCRLETAGAKITKKIVKLK